MNDSIFMQCLLTETITIAVKVVSSTSSYDMSLFSKAACCQCTLMPSSACNICVSSTGQTPLRYWVHWSCLHWRNNLLSGVAECFQAPLKHGFVLLLLLLWLDMNYVLWQYKVDLVSSVNQFIFSSWGKKKCNPVRLQWLWSMTMIIYLWSMSFFKRS